MGFHVRENYLFVEEDFIGHSGGELHWKIECDALTAEDWKGLARMIMDHETRSFGSVEGIPRGGLPLAVALTEYATEGPPMIVDDVYTTGASFKEYCKKHYDTKSFDYNPKWVVFARTKPEDRSGVKALFTMPN